MGTSYELCEIRRPDYDMIYVDRSYASNPNFVSFKVHQGSIPIVGPIVKAQPGSPRKNKRRGADEPSKPSGKKFRTMTCQRCGNTGHNLRGCRGQGAPIDPNKQKKKKRVVNTQESNNEDAVYGGDGGMFYDSQQAFDDQPSRESGMGSSRLRGRGSSTSGGRGKGRSTLRGRGRGRSLSQPLRKSPRKNLKKTYIDM